jgi:hypothetical protein
MKALKPIEHQAIWDLFDTWDWQEQSKWALANPRSDCLRRMFIEEQQEFAKERRIGAAIAEALDARLRELVKDVITEVASGALHR